MSGLRQRSGTGRGATLAIAATIALLPATVPAQAPIKDSSDFGARLQRLEQVMSTGTLVDLLERVEQLQREVRDLRGQVELQGHELTQLKQRQRDLYLDVDGRLQRFEQGGAPPIADAGTGAPPATDAGTTPPAAPEPSVGTGGTAAAAPTEPAAPAGPDPLKEQADYQAAFNLLKEARYDDAAKALGEFLKNYPDGAYADNAQYWLGESFYVTRKFQQSLAEFEKLVARFPSSQKYTHALLKIGYIHDELGNRADAVRVLDELVNRFPSSAAAGLAKKRLERLR